MHFLELITKLSENQKLKIYVDMDGVIAAYDFGKPLRFDIKRPLYTNIRTLEKISKLENVELHILSVCVTDNQVLEKNDWLDKYAPFFEKTNRNILSKETYKGYTSKELKANFLKDVKKDRTIILIDDDNEVLRHVRKEVKEVILFQDSELVD